MLVRGIKGEFDPQGQYCQHYAPSRVSTHQACPVLLRFVHLWFILHELDHIHSQKSPKLATWWQHQSLL